MPKNDPPPSADDEPELPEKAAAKLAAEARREPPEKPRHGHQVRQWHRNNPT